MSGGVGGCAQTSKTWSSIIKEHNMSKVLIAARVLATYLIPGCVRRGVRLGSENSSGAGGVWAQARAQAGPKPGPSWAQAGSQKIPKIKILKIKVRSAQNAGKVWISSKKLSWPSLGSLFAWAGKIPKNILICLFLLLYRFGALAAIHPRWAIGTNLK